MGLSKALGLTLFCSGYKICKLVNGRIESAFNQGVTKEIPKDVWVNEADYRRSDTPEKIPFLNEAFKTYDYPVGWHVYTNREEALWALDHLGRSFNDLILAPVSLDRCVAYGEQSYRPNLAGEKRVFLKVVVCKEIKILHGIGSIVL